MATVVALRRSRQEIIEGNYRLALNSRYVPPHVQHEAARLIALRLRILADGPFSDPDTWCKVAEQNYGLMVRQYHKIGGARGQYARMGHWKGKERYSGAIAVNTAYPRIEQARAYVHEISHHLLVVWQPPQLISGEDLITYYDDTQDGVHHRIARRVERLVIR